MPISDDSAPDGKPRRPPVNDASFFCFQAGNPDPDERNRSIHDEGRTENRNLAEQDIPQGFMNRESGAKSPLLSIILATYNRSALLRKSLESIAAQTFRDFEVIVVDDNSTDSTPLVLRVFTDERIRVTRLNRRVGSSEAMNVGGRLARGEYILFSADDMPMTPDYLQRMLDAFSAYRGLAVVVGRAIDIDSDEEVGIDYIKSGAPVTISRLTGNIAAHWDVSNPEFTDLPTAHGCMLAKKAWLSEVGWFRHYPINGFREESDLSVRLRKKGLRLIFEPGAVIYHVKTAKGGQRTSRLRYRYWVHVNHATYLIRNFGVRGCGVLFRYALKDVIWEDLVLKPYGALWKSAFGRTQGT